MIKSISAAAHYAVAHNVIGALASFVETHNASARPDVGGYNHPREPGDLEFPSCRLTERVRVSKTNL